MWFEAGLYNHPPAKPGKGSRPRGLGAFAAGGSQAIPLCEQRCDCCRQCLFFQKKQLEADPYLETREKEDAFLEKVVETLQEGLRQATVPGLVPLLQLLQGAQAGTPAPAKEPEANTGTDWDAALDFAGSF